MKRALVVWVLSCVLFSLPALGEPARGVVFEDLNGNGQRDTSEPGIAGIAVSDGRTVVLSDADGLYELEIEAESILFISKPAGFAAPLDEQNRPLFYYRHYPEGSKTAGKLRFRGVDATGPLPKSVDFPLTRVVPRESFRVLCLADTQPQNEAELQFLRDDILAELGGSDAAFGLTLGDILYDDLALFPRYSALVSTVGIPWYNLPGNHEINYLAQDHSHARETFKRHFGPAYYSFNYGRVHFVALDTVHYLGTGVGREEVHPRGAGTYVGKLGDQQLEWLRQDLAAVPKDHLVVLTMHIPLASRLGGDDPTINVADRRELLAALEGRRHLLALAGHMHQSEHIYFGQEEGFAGEEALHQHTLSAASGSWWSGPLDPRGIPTAWQRDGAPNGYYLLHVDGTDARVEFRAAGKAATDQMRIVLDSAYHGALENNLLYYRPGELLNAPVDQEQLYSTEVLVNLFDGGPNSRLTLRIDGGEPFPMQPVVRLDPFIEELYARYRTLVKTWVDAQPSHHLWSAPLPADLSPGPHHLEVLAVDEYGSHHQGQRVIEVISR